MKIITAISYSALIFTFIYLKAAGIINWPWLLVLFPITVPAAMLAAILISAFIEGMGERNGRKRF